MPVFAPRRSTSTATNRRFGHRWLVAAAFAATALAAWMPSPAHAEGSRSLYPSTYPAGGSRADLDVSAPATKYLNVVARSAFLYVYAQAGEYIELGSRNRANGGDVLVYDPQSFGQAGNETVPSAASFSCATGSTQPGTHYFGGATGTITTRAAELAGPNSADGSASVSGGFAPCAYQAPVTGVYGVRFTVATSGGAGANGVINPPAIGNATISAWDVTVRTDAASLADLNGRLFTYAFVAWTGGNSRPIYSTLYFVSQDGFRYRQVSQGLDPNGFALFANLNGFSDTGQPLYKDIRGNSATVSNFPANVSAQPAQYPIFFSDIGPGGANAIETARVLQALGIAQTPPTATVSAVSYTGNSGGNVSTVAAGGDFGFTSQNTLTYQIVISRNGVDFDPATVQNRVLTGVALSGTHSVHWDGRDNDGNAFPVGNYAFRLTGRNGELHFPLVDDEGNTNGGPTFTVLNGDNASDATRASIVYFDDRGYRTRSGGLVGTLNGFLCGAATPTPPTPNNGLIGIDSSNANFNGSGKYYRNWPGAGNANTDCATTAAFGDAKGLDLWAAQSTQATDLPLAIVDAPTTADVGTSASADANALPGQTVYGSFSFRNDGTVTATGVTYTVMIGDANDRPSAVTFTLLPNGVTASYDAATGVVTLTGMPATLTAAQSLNFNFNYVAPAPGTVPVTTTIAAQNESPVPGVSPDTASASTAILISNATTAVSVPASAAAGAPVDGTITFANAADATATADHLTYSIVIGASGSHPASVTFPTLPAGVTATYDPATGVVTLMGMPTSLDPGETVAVGFEYVAPASGTVPVTASVATTTPQSSTADDAANGSTVVVAADPLQCDGTFYQVRQIGSTSRLFTLDRSVDPYVANQRYDIGLLVNAMGYDSVDNYLYALRNPTTAGAALVRLGANGVIALSSTAVSGLPAAGFDGGAIDKQGNYLVSRGGSGPLYRIAGITGATPAPVATQVTQAADAAPPAGYAGFATFLIGDIAARPFESTPALTVLYGVRAAEGGTVYLYRIAVSNPGSATPTAAISRIATTLPATTFGSVFFDAAGAFYAYDNSATATAGFYTVNLATGAALSVSGASAASSSDGGSCVFADASIDVVKSAGTPVVVTPTSFDVPYTLVVGNRGAVTTPNVQVSENLALTFATGSPTVTLTAPAVVGAPCTANAAFDGNSQFALLTGSDALAAGAQCTISFTARVTYPSAASIPSAPQQNTAYASSTFNGPNPGYTFPGGTPLPPTGVIASDQSTDAPALPATPNGDTPTPTPVQLPQVPRVTITKTASPTGALTPGATVTWTVTVANTGSASAAGTTVSDPLPAGIASASWTCAVGSGAAACPNASGSLPLAETIATLPASSSVVYTIVATVGANPPSSIVNTASSTPPGGGLCGPGDTAPPCTASTTNPVTLVYGDLVVNKTVAGGPSGYSASFPIGVACVVGTDPVTGIQPGATQSVTAGTGTAGSVTFTQIPQGATCSVSEGTLPTAPAGYTWATPAITQPGTISATPAVASVANALVRGTGGVVVTKHIEGSAAIVAGVNGAFGFSVACGADGTFSGSVTVAGGADASTTVGAIPVAAVCTVSETSTPTAPAGYEWQPPTYATNPVTIPNTGNATITVTNPLAQSPADIAVTKTVDNAAPNVGDNVTFTITATNNGPADATGVAVSDGLPPGLTFVSATASGTTTYDQASGTWTIGALASNDSATLQVVATVTLPGTITNTATVSASDQPDPDPSNNTAGSPVNANASADIQVLKTVDDATPDVGATVTFTIAASNNGPDDATGVEVTDVLPAGLTLVSATPSVGTYDAGSGVWVIGNFANGAAATLQLLVTVDVAGAILNTTRVSASDQFDPAPGNNQSGATVNDQQADIAVLKVVDNNAPDVGDTVTFTVTAHNNGPDDATGVVITDALPAGLDYVSSVPSRGAYDPASGAWTLGNLAATGADSTATLSIVATVSAPGAHTNTATRTASDQSDPNPSNDSASASVSGNPLADLAVTKSGPATVTPGGNVVYVVTLTNNGPNDAVNARVTDPTPPGLTFVGNSGDCVTAYPCSFGTLAAGASVTVTSTYSVPADYAGANPIVNTATAASDTPDPDAGNNQASANTGVGAGSADLVIVKSGPATAASGGTIIYTLAISNAGPGPANGAGYSDTLPPGLTQATATCGAETGGAACVSQPVVSGGVVSGTIGTLPSGGTVVVTITAIAPAGPVTLQNTAGVTPPIGVTDPDPSNNQSTVSTNVGAGVTSANLAVVKTGPAAAISGAQILYAIAVTNNGPDTASAVVLDDPAPSGLAFVSASAPCTGGFPCTLGDLASGASVQVSVTYSVTATQGSVVNTATVTSLTPDPDPTDNESSVSTTIGVPAGTADLRIAKTGPATATAGGYVDYSLVVGNLGPDAVNDAVVSDPTPAGLTFVSASAPCAGGFPCAVGALPAGASITITTRYAVDAGYQGGIVNIATVGSPSVTDPTPDDNTSTFSVPVTGGGVPGSPAAPVPLDGRWALLLLALALGLLGMYSARRARR